MSGRKHGYETGAVDGMALPLRCLRALGCEVLVQTNAAGSLGRILYEGKTGVPQDKTKGLEMLKKATDAGIKEFQDYIAEKVK